MSAVDRAIRGIRALILEDGLVAGDRLPAERDLAGRLGVSRPALREAIRRLVDAQLLDVRHGSGAYLAPVELEEVFAVRLRLEPLAARLAAEDADDAARARLTEIVAAMAGVVNEPARFAALDLELHRLVAIASGNRVLADALDRLTELTVLSRATSAPSADAREAALADVEVVADTIGRRDGDAAEAAMARHLGRMRAVAVAGATAR